MAGQRDSPDTGEAGQPHPKRERMGLDSPRRLTEPDSLKPRLWGLEHLDPLAWYDTAVEFFTGYARALPYLDPAGAIENEGEFRAGMTTWLQHGLPEADLRSLSWSYSGSRPDGSRWSLVIASESSAQCGGSSPRCRSECRRTR